MTRSTLSIILLSMRFFTFLVLSLITAGFPGCAAPSYFVDVKPSLREAAREWDMQSPRHLPMFAAAEGMRGETLAWDDLLAAIAWAHVIIIGEQHDDEMGHFFQQAVVDDALLRWPHARVSMEMLERDEQWLVDDYFEGIIDQPTFVRLTHSESWGGREKKWDAWYQPMIDTAKHTPTSGVIAANAPRRYVRLARTDGYDRLRSLPRERRAFFSLPISPLDSPYRERFIDLMLTMGNHSGDEQREADDPAEVAERRARIKDSFRSQFLWDSTMAASIAAARPNAQRKVIHMVGQFHSDFEGGLVRELRARAPGVRALVLSMQRVDAQPLRDEDHARADIVIYTGARPEPETDTTEEEPGDDAIE